MKKIIILKYIILLFMLLNSSTIFSQKTTDYDLWMNLKSEELLNKAEDFEKREKMDSALILYSIITNRSDVTSSNEEDIKLTSNAYAKKAILYFSFFFDYSKAYENILAAQELKEKTGIECIFVDLVTAAFYNIIAVTSDNTNFGKKALDYCSKAYDTAYKKKDRDYMNTIFANMILFSSNNNDFTKLDKSWKTYQNDNDSSYNYKFNELFYNHLKFREKKEYDESILYAEKMLELSNNNSDLRRILISYTSLINIYEITRNPQKAFKYLVKEEELVKKNKMREHEIELLFSKVKMYKMMQEMKKADSCMHVYLIKKDSLLNMKQLNTLNRILYEGESRKLENEIKDMNIKNKMYNDIIIIVLIFVFILIVMVILLYVKIKELKKSNITIYENNEEFIKHEERERQKLKDEVSRIDNNIKDEDIIEDSTNIEKEGLEEEKYKNTSISNDEKKKLLDKILTVMEDVDEICSESFSGARLAELTGYKYNYVSLVINENYGCNFNTFVNRFRIKEACRRLADDKNYGNYTIDTISSSLGFKSRTTLTTSFKKIVGLTPSQYRTIAKEKHT